MTGSSALSMDLDPLASGLRWAVSEARMLLTVERFLGLLEDAPGAPAPPDSLPLLVPVLRAWRRALRERDDDAALEAGDRATSAIQACRQAVLERDRAIPAYRIRWACEHAPISFGRFAELARFYRTLPCSSASQSKYEYVLTRLFAGPLRSRRELIAPPEELAERLAEMQWRSGAAPVEVPEARLGAVVAELAAFVREAREQRDLASLTESSLFRRAGAYKAQLGEALFEPLVAVAVVECNLRLGNVFCELLAREEAAHAGETVEAKVVESAPAAAPAAAPAPAPAQPPATAPATAAAAAEPPPDSPSPRAYELGKLTENAAVIARYLEPPRSPEVYRLGLDKFLSPLPGAGAERLPDEAAERRQALELILSADDLIWAREQGPAGDQHKALVKEATRKLQALGNTLRGLVTTAQREAPDTLEALHYVSDHLLWARLRLAASLNRPARKRISLAQARKPVVTEDEPETSPERRRLTASIGIAALALLLFLPGAVYVPTAVDAEVRVLDPGTLPGGEHVQDARQHGSVLYVTVLPTWRALSQSSQRDHLRALAEFGSREGIDTVSVSDPYGEPLAAFAEGEPMFMSDLPREDGPRP